MQSQTTLQFLSPSRQEWDYIVPRDKEIVPNKTEHHMQKLQSSVLHKL